MAIEIFMPRMGMSMQEGTLIEWLKKAGESVAVGEPVARIETNKVITDLVAEASGIFGNILVQPDEVVRIGTVLAYIYAPGEAIPAVAAGKPVQPTVKQPTSFAENRLEDKKDKNLPLSEDTKGHLTPVAKRAALDLGLSLDELAAAFPGQRINREDVIEWSQKAQVKTPSQDHEVIPMSNMRKVIAQRMVSSLHESAQLTLIRNVDVTNLVEARHILIEEGKQLPIPRPTYTDFLVKAMALAIPAVPQINSRLNGDKIEILHTVNIGVAVALDEGLITPVVKNVQALTVFEISLQIQNLAQRARQGQLKADEVEGSTITITNLGSEGIDAFTPILNPGESAVLGVGRIRTVWATGANGNFGTCSELTLSLTIDHRVVDGLPGARFLARLAEILSEPKLLIP